MNTADLELYFIERRKIEADYYIDSFINLDEIEKKQKPVVGKRKKYRIWSESRRQRKGKKIW
jgi:hypothetical protein